MKGRGSGFKSPSVHDYFYLKIFLVIIYFIKMGKEYVAKVGRGSKSLSNFVLAGYGLRILPNFSVTVRPPSISKVKEDEINEIMKMIHSLDEIRDDYIYCSTYILQYTHNFWPQILYFAKRIWC